MKTKVSKAQLEVWEWKEKAYNQIKDMSLDKGIEFIIQQTKQIADETSSGIYFVEIVVKNMRLVKEIIILK